MQQDQDGTMYVDDLWSAYDDAVVSDRYALSDGQCFNNTSLSNIDAVRDAEFIVIEHPARHHISAEFTTGSSKRRALSSSSPAVGSRHLPRYDSTAP